ncbi:uncharacterized protein LOC102469409 isoform X2 [Tupaia chinensis]|nr:uncharacterized protein LOC102469409 isoform X2 [Tupaia chinensis]
MWSRPSERSARLRASKLGTLQEERWVNAISKSVPEMTPTEDNHDKEKEEEETGNKTLLAEPRQESVWGLVAWPKPSQEQAPWWEEEYFSLPPLTGPCLCECSLRTKVMLHPQPTPASCFIPPTFPALASKKEPTSVEDQPQREPRSACHTKAPKAGPKLPPKAKFQSCPKAGKASQALRPLAPMAIWPQVLIKNPAKSSPLKGRHAPAAKEAASSLGTSDNPLPHLSSK